MSLVTVHSSISSVIGGISLNFVTSVAIIWATKICFRMGFSWATALTAIHFLVTYLGLEICALWGVFERKKLPFLELCALSFVFCCFIVFANLSLQYNAIDVYQVLKVATAPVIILIHIIFYKRWLTAYELLSLTLVTIGVTVATATSLDVNLWGTIWGILGIISASVYQVWVETKQIDLQCSAPQLLYYQAPISFLMLVAIMPFADTLTGPSGLFNYKWTLPVTAAVIGSALLAFLVNLSTYMVIGQTSPITYNVLGHCKMVCILVSGFLFFGDQFSYKSFAGVVVAVSGMMWYTYLKLANVKPKTEGSIEKKFDIEDGAEERSVGSSTASDEETRSLTKHRE